MSPLTCAELRKMPPEDLRREIRDLRKAWTVSRMELTMGKSKASHLHRRSKRDLARALTILQEKRGEDHPTQQATRNPPREVAPPPSVRRRRSPGSPAGQSARSTRGPQRAS